MSAEKPELNSVDESLASAFDLLQGSLLAYVNKKLSDKAVAEDLVQNVFEKAIRSRNNGKVINNVRAWLFAITRTTLADHYRSKNIDFSAIESVDEAELAFEDDEDFLPTHNLSNCLQPFINQLPANYRESIVHGDIAGKPLKLLAEAEGVSVSAIKSRASRARMKLKDLILDCCDVHLKNGVIDDYEPKKNEKRKNCCN